MAYIPHAADFLTVAASWGVGAVLLLAGAGLTGRRTAPEYQIIAGWGPCASSSPYGASSFR